MGTQKLMGTKEPPWPDGHPRAGGHPGATRTQWTPQSPKQTFSYPYPSLTRVLLPRPCPKIHQEKPSAEPLLPPPPAPPAPCGHPQPPQPTPGPLAQQGHGGEMVLGGWWGRNLGGGARDRPQHAPRHGGARGDAFSGVSLSHHWVRGGDKRMLRHLLTCVGCGRPGGGPRLWSPRL